MAMAVAKQLDYLVHGWCIMAWYMGDERSSSSPLRPSPVGFAGVFSVTAGSQKSCYA
jgi:hypothetical protein